MPSSVAWDIRGMLKCATCFLDENERSSRKDRKLKISLDCISCIIHKAFQTCELVGMEEAEKEIVSRKILQLASEVSFDQTSTHVTHQINKFLQDHTGEDDPYRNAKSFYTDLALRAYPELKLTIRESENPFNTAVRMALAGSSIDYIFNGKIDNVGFFNKIENVLNSPLGCDHIALLDEKVQSADTILYLGDNAGETVFDRLLIEELPTDKVIYAVKGGPAMNDATVTDARFAGLTDKIMVIENGSDAPGTILDLCSSDFRDLFHEADLVISKGQGNFKTLHAEEREIFFIFRVKCVVVARHIGCSRDDLLIWNSKQKIMASPTGNG